MLLRILNWFVASTWFKKYAAIIGGVALGMWIQARYWKQIRATLNIWDISREEWLQFLLMIVGAAGISLSIGLSLVKNQRKKKDA